MMKSVSGPVLFVLMCVVAFLAFAPNAAAASTCEYGCSAGSFFSNCTGSCVKCSVGFYCHGNLTTPQPCPAGTYSNQEGNKLISQCSDCPAGSYSKAGATSCQTCPVNHYSADQSGACTACPAGHVTNSAKDGCDHCPLGTYASNTTGTCAPCSSGYSCLSRTHDREKLCPSGTYSDEGTGVCRGCEAGFACPSTSIQCAAASSNRNKYACPPGTYAAGNQTGCTTCPPMHFCPDTRSAVMHKCPAGFYSMGGAVNCSVCPTGFVCPPDSVTGAPEICSGDGTSSASRTNCSMCPAGFQCPTSQVQLPCPTGTYSTAGSLSCTNCPAGHSCASPSQSPVVCPVGTYSPGGVVPHCHTCNTTGALAFYQNDTGKTQCEVCPAGFMCKTIYTTPVACLRGYMSVAGARHCTHCSISMPGVATYTPGTGSSICELCPAGSYCKSPTMDPVSCPGGTFSGAASFNCSLCPAGFACGISEAAPTACTNGTYSTGGQSECQPCPVNYQCPAVNQAPILCDVQNGWYSPLGDNQCYPCPAGTACDYNPEFQNFTYTVCTAGSYRIAGSTECKICPPGFMCPFSDFAPIRCPDGMYSVPGQTSCSVCPAGYACHNLTAPIVCPSGWYSQAGDKECRPCEAGYRCINPWSSPTLCLPGTFSEGLSTNCTICPRGWECPVNNRFLGAARECVPGYYSTGGQTACTPCQGGSYCPSIFHATQHACPHGWMSHSGQANCTRCPAGFACANPNRDISTPEPCQSGTWSTGGQTECHICPAGFACPYEDKEYIVTCRNGTFTEPGQASCVTCAAGHYCPLTAVDVAQPMFGVIGVGRQVPCPAGEYAPAGSFQCFRCPKGFYCTSTTANDGGRQVCPTNYLTAKDGAYAEYAATGCMPCPGGSQCLIPGEPADACPTGQYSTNGVCHACPAGYMCETTQSAPTPCPAGTFSYNNSVACKPCYAGYLCPVQSNTPTPSDRPCPVGSYCPSGSTVAVLCPAGTYGKGQNGHSVEQACSDCHAGYFCPAGTAGLSAMNSCPEGSYCPPGSPFPTPCPAGTYSNDVSSTTRATCVLCPEGYFCPAGTARYAANPCPPGFYCPPGTGSGFENGCPAGTYSAEYKLTSAAQCYQCPPGHQCPTVGLTAAVPCAAGSYQPDPGASFCRACEAGFACTLAGMTSSHATPCDPGHFCPSGSSLPNSNPCHPGTYTFKTNLASADQCEVCWRGYACPQGTGKSPNPLPIQCSTGSYCPGVETPGNGKYYYAGSYTGPTTGAADQYPCLKGTYTASTDLYDSAQCTDCPSGQYCPGGGAAPAGPCDAGYFCPKKSYDIQQVPCAAGTYNPDTGKEKQQDCKPCLPGNYCPEGSSAMTQCPLGSYTPYNKTKGQGPSGDVKSELCLLCPAGYYCPLGSTNPIACEPGFYSPAGAGTCSSCEGGRYCPQKATSADQKERLFLCPAGLLCQPGLSRIPSAEYDACPKGNYCPIGTSSAVPCVPGTYNPHVGRSSLTECLTCTKGYYCSVSGAANVTGECDPGFYCPTGSTTSTQEPCPARYYRSIPRGESEDFCSVCPRGYYCPEGTASPIPCTRGYYCISGTDQPQPCPIGTFGNTTHLKSQDECSACTAGYYCDGLGLAHPTGLCDPGYFCIGRAFTSAPPGLPTGGLCPKGGYCPPGSSFPTACAEGTFNNFTGGSTQQDCTACTPGYYCSGSNLPFPTGPCAAGYYCTGGAALPTQFRSPAGHFSLPGSPAPEECPLGTFNPSPAQGACTACIAGFYCPTRAMVTYLPCPPGGYCPAASILPKPCVAGTFQPETRRQNISNCLPCSPGHYCQDTNLTAPTDECVPGYYCRRACITSTCSRYSSNYAAIENTLPTGETNNIGGPCPYGHYCGNGTANPSACPAGTLRDSLLGTTLETDCHACPSRYYCATNGMSMLVASNSPSLCTPGYYCPGRISTTSRFGCSDTTCSTHEGELCSLPHVGCASEPNEDLRLASNRLCPLGFFCPVGSDFPTMCGYLPGNMSTYAGRRGMTGCDVCPRGYWCDNTVLSSIQTPVLCTPGHYCPKGTNRHQPRCPKGTWSDVSGNENITNCKFCPAGRYCPEEGLQDIGTSKMPFCLGGYYCTTGAMDGYGTEGILGGIGGICPVGHYCPNGTTHNNSYPCPPGTYKPTTHGTSSNDCLWCDPGMYCQGSGLHEVSGPCASGFYCPRGCSDPYCTNKQCTVGIDPYEPQRTGGPCPRGHFCPTNFISNVGSIMPRACPEGTYADVPMLSTCKDCPAGHHCGLGQIHPMECGRGNYCPPKTFTSNVPRCPPGTYQNWARAHNITECHLCPPGRYCPYFAMNTSWGYCDAGFYCTAGASTITGRLGTQGGISGVCPPGHYCPKGTKLNTSFPCPPGTYQPFTGQRNITSCLACRPGYYCAGWGLFRVTGPCASGYYCPTACEDPQCSNKPCKGNCAHPTPYDFTNPYAAGGICPSGHYCPQVPQHDGMMGATAPIMCPAGTYAPDSGMDHCLSCPAGAWCGVRERQPQRCPSGHYCPKGTPSPYKFPCPIGTFLPSYNNSNYTDCVLCSAGSYCDKTGLNVTTGYCLAGYYCTSGASTPDAKVGIRGGSAGPCPVGHYCPQGTTAANQFPCHPGSYQPYEYMTNKSSCLHCTPGFHCPNFAQTAATDKCAQGYYCPRACSDQYCSNKACSNNCQNPYLSGGECPAGFICPGTTLRGTVFPEACPAGTYSPNTGRYYCLNCPQGHYCAPTTVIPKPCPLGRYCPVGTDQNMPRCPAGSYNDATHGKNLTDCALCKAGRYCSVTGNSSYTDLCFAGYYCTAGATDGRGRTGALGGEGGICPPGYYCPKGTEHRYQFPCPAGTYQPRFGATNASQCLTCTPGYYCEKNGQRNVTSHCQSGYYCPRGCTDRKCSNAWPCKGNCSLQVGGACPLGHYCPLKTVVHPIITDRDGVINVEGSVAPIPCPMGQFTGQTGRDSCDICPAGFYCLQGTQAQPHPIPCPAGGYCPAGTASIIPQCPEGSYSNRVGLNSSTQCYRCAGGRYCDSKGMTIPGSLCAKGYYCTGGAKDPMGRVGLLGGADPLFPKDQYGAQICPPGHYCPPGATVPSKCPPGTYNPHPGGANMTEACIECDGGLYCDQAGLLAPVGPCIGGYFCPRGCVDKRCYSRVCSGLPGGDCPAGFYCPNGTATPFPCPAGTTASSPGAIVCPACPAGHYCPQGTSDPVTCPQGRFCPQGTGSVIPMCPTGSFSNHTGLVNVSECARCSGAAACTVPGLVAPNEWCEHGHYCTSGAKNTFGETGTLGGVGGPCHEGYYCPPRTAHAYPCAPGTYNPTKYGNSTKSCIACTPGKYCETYGLSAPTGDCDAGFYCVGGDDVARPSGGVCIAGHYCGAGSAYPTPCSPGRFYTGVQASADSVCDPCPPGKFCLAGTSTAGSGDCAGGWYCQSGANVSKPQVNGGYCTPGYFCPPASVNPQPCPPGKYCDVSHLWYPAGGCHAGYYCTSQSSTPTPEDGVMGGRCPAGSYCPQNSSKPFACPSGTYNPHEYQKSGLSCLPCTAGHFCPDNGQAGVKNNCSAGYYCPPGMTVGNPDGYLCPKGHACPEATASPMRCHSGYYQDQLGQPFCKKCPAGSYCNQKDLCPGTNFTTPRICPRGYFCPNGTEFATQFPCPNGTYSNAEGLVDSSACKLCDGGRYCNKPAMSGSGNECDAGFYCIAGAVTPRPRDGVTGDICPQGYYCLKGTTEPTPCPTSTYGAAEGLTKESECTTCTPGHYCSGLNNTKPTGKCAPGYYCPAGQTSPYPVDYLCPYGQYCPGGTAHWIQCPSGTHAVGTGQSACQTCSPGRFCDNHYPCSTCLQTPCVGNYTCERSCPIGNYCPKSTRYANQYPCPKGRYGGAADLTNASSCRPCPPGQFCPYSGMSSLFALLCSPGYFCKGGSYTATPNDGETGFECPAGKYCTLGTEAPKLCPPGTYNPRVKGINITSCVKCRPGKACTIPGLDEPDRDCTAGFYCPGGQVSDTPAEYTCPVGHYCPTGSTWPLSCPMGTWANSTGQQTCDPCPEGYYCNQHDNCPTGNFSMPQLCFAGHYCPAGTQYGDENPCPIGTFSTKKGLSHEDNCTICAGGRACTTPGLTYNIPFCHSGYYCHQGAKVVNPTDGNITGGVCPAGSYCPTGTQKPFGCPAGTFSTATGLANASQCQYCTPGMYCETTGLTAPTGNCSAGYFCPPNQASDKPTGQQCHGGKYCPEGSHEPLDCPNGTYVPIGVTGRQTCLPCLEKKFCNFVIQQQPPYSRTEDYVVPVTCPRGYFCPQGTEHDTQFPCPSGTFSNNSAGLHRSSDCTPCTSGRFCALPGQIKETGICEAGYYCAAGAIGSIGNTVSRPTLPGTPTDVGGECPPGRYCPFGSGSEQGIACPPGTYFGGAGARNASWCLKCRPGYFCRNPGNTDDQGDGKCDSGFYCPGGNKAKQNPEFICPKGHFCGVGSARPTPCLGGTYQPRAGTSGCEICPRAHFCPRGSATPIVCFHRHYCGVGTAYPEVCPNGTYAKAGAGAMSSVTECALCPAGSYCTNGTITGPCAAGHWCQFGNSVPDPDHATDVHTKKLGGICPIGHFCPEGTPVKMPCTNQTVGTREGLKATTDCEPCPKGHYCIETSSTAIPCPRGYYCPGYVGRSIGLVPCPVGTFNPDTLAEDISYCRSCKEGYYCPTEALTTTYLHPTPPGYYSAVGQSEPYPCPGGTYQAKTNGTAANTSACVECPVGHFCGPSSSTWNQTCPEGTFCPPGSTYPFHCPGGHYCPRKALQPIECPMGYYCPPLSVAPLLCWNGTYCPRKTEVPLLCPNGYVSRNDTALRIDLEESCVACEPGTWSTNTLYCELCSAGYLCYGATTTATPTNKTTEFGEICPKGHYCEAGSFAPAPCQPGTFNNRTGGQAISACTPCPANMYQPDQGTDYCRACGKSAFSNLGSAVCECKGGARSFQPGDGSCRCWPGYIFYTDGQRLNEDDSELSCQKKIFERCPSGQVRSSIGTCVKDTDATSCEYCKDKKGKLDPQIGLCVCDEGGYNVQESVCDDECVKNSNRMFIDVTTDSNGNVGRYLVHVNPTTGEETRINLDATKETGALGSKSCAPNRTSCEVKLVRLGEQGARGVYNASADLLTGTTTTSDVNVSDAGTDAPTNATTRRMLSQATGASNGSASVELALSNPIVCLNYGEAMIWDVSDPSREHYPVYQKDSLLNTNQNFDYTEFRTFAEKMKDPNLNIRTFMFTFSEPGVYVFNDNANFYSVTVVRVVSETERCDAAAFEPITESAMLRNGISRENELLLTPDWILIGVLMAGLFCLVAGTIGGLWHFRRQTWGVVGTALPRYRNLGMQALTSGTFAALASKGTNTKRGGGGMLSAAEDHVNVPSGSSRVMTLRLDKPMKDFVPSEFVEIISKEAGTEPQNVLILSVTEGSTIVRFVLTGMDDSQAAANLLVNRISEPTNDIHTKLDILAYEEEGERDAQHPAFNMANLEDEFWDYERQIDLEGFNVRTLYDKLEDQTIHVVSQLANQKDDVLLLCDKILVESEALKDMFLKIKIDIDERTKKDKELQELRDAKLSTGQVEFDLPEDLKHVLAKFLEDFFQENLGTLLAQTNIQTTTIIREEAPETVVVHDVRETTTVIDETGATTTDKTTRKIKDDPDVPPPPSELDDVDAFKDMFGKTFAGGVLKDAAGDSGLKRSGSISGKVGKRKTRIDNIPNELLDDSDQDDDERWQRGEKRTEYLARRLNRVRRTMDRIVMPSGLEDVPPEDGVMTPEEAEKRKKEREEWQRLRREERKQQDQIPDEMKDDPSLPHAVRQARQHAREEHIARRLVRLRDALQAVDVPANLRDEPSLNEQDRDTRRTKRDNYIRQKLEKARKVRAETMVPMELDDDSDTDEKTRAELRDKRGDLSAEILIKNPNAPLLPDPSQKGITPNQEDNRRKAQDFTTMKRITDARTGLGSADAPNGLSDRSDDDDATRERKRQERDGSPAAASPVHHRRGGPSGKAKGKGLSSDGKAGLFIAKQDFSVLDVQKVPAEYKDDSDLDDDDREVRRDLRHAFKAGRSAQVGDITLPENESERGIDDKERSRRKEINEAYKRGREAKTASVSTHASLKQAKRVIKEAEELAEDDDSKKFVEMGKQADKAAVMPSEYMGTDDRKQKLQLAFNQGKKAASVSAVPEELEEVDGESAKKKEMRAAFLKGKDAASASGGIPTELEDSHQLADTERERRSRLRDAYQAGRAASQATSLPQELEEAEPDAKTRKDMLRVFEAGKAAAKAKQESNVIPTELRDDIPLLEPEEIERRRKLQAVFMQGYRGQAGEQMVKELDGDSDMSSTEKKELKKAFEAGSKAQRAADALPAELEETPDMTAADRDALSQKRANFLKGRAAQKMGDQFTAELVDEATTQERKNIIDATKKGANAHHALNDTPEELRDDDNLTAAERERRAKLRNAFNVGKKVRVAAEMPEELPEDEPEAESQVTRKSSLKGGGKKGVKFGGSTSVPGEEIELSEEQTSELNRVKKDHHQAYKRLKEKQKAITSTVLEELEEDAISTAKTSDESMNDVFLKERKELQEKHDQQLAKATDKDAMKKKQIHEMQELQQSQEADRKDTQADLMKRAAEKKAKMKAILDQRHLNELRLQKTLQVEQEKEIKALRDEASMAAALGEAAREEDLKKQKDALLEKLKLRERRQKAKANKEKEILETELRATEGLERDSLETEMRKKKEQLLKRARDTKTNPKELEEEVHAIEKKHNNELENAMGKLNSKLEAERITRERELAERHANEKEEELRAAQGAVDKLLAAKRRLAAKNGGDTDDGKISAAAKNTVDLLAQQQEQREKLKQELAKQREEEARKLAKDDVAAKEEAAKEIARREKANGEKLTEAQKREIFDECRKNAAQMESALSADQKKQQDEAKKRLEERRKKKEAELHRQQLEAMQAEIKRQEDEQRQKEQELQKKISVKPATVEVSAEVAAEEEEMQRRAHRMKEDLRKKHEEEARQLEQKLEDDLKKQQDKELAKIKAEHQRKKMEMMSQQTAKESMAMTEEQKAALLKEHEEESKKLQSALDRDAAAQKAKLQEQLEARKRKKKNDLSNKQKEEARVTENKADEEREEFIRQEKLKAEKKVIDETLSQNKGKGADMQDVAQVVMAERHREEVNSLAQRQQKRRLEEQDAREKKLGDDKEDLNRRMNSKIETELLNIGADDPNRDNKEQQIRNKAAKLLTNKMRELEDKHNTETEAIMENLEMQFAEEQLQLKVQQWNEVAGAAGMVAPEAALAKYQQKAAQRAVDDAEQELLAFRESKQAEQDNLNAKLQTEKEEYDKKMQEKMEKLKRDQEEEFARKEKAMMEELAKEKQRKEQKLREARLATVAGDKASGSGPSAQESAEIKKRLMEEVKEDERRLKEQLEREKARQQADLDSILQKKREKKRLAALKKAEAAAAGDSMEASVNKTVSESVKETAQTITTQNTTNVTNVTNVTNTENFVMSAQPAAVATGAAPAGAMPAMDPASHQQWVTSVVQQLTHSPLMEKISKIERMVAGQVRHGVLSYYLDSKDRQIRSNEGKLEALELSELSTTEFVVYCFAASVKENIQRAGIKMPPVKIAVAKSLPDSATNASAFRNSYYYDHGRRTLYVRNTRLANLGEFVLIMVHGLAHVKAAMTEDRQNFAAWNDADPAFLTEFYGLLEVCTEEMFYMRLPSSQAQRDVQDGRSYRPDSIMSAESLSAMEEQLRTIGKQNREGFLKTYLMM